jgi:hypothetical protein
LVNFFQFLPHLWTKNHVLKKVGRASFWNLFSIWCFLNLHALGYLKSVTKNVCTPFWVNKSLSMWSNPKWWSLNSLGPRSRMGFLCRCLFCLAVSHTTRLKITSVLIHYSQTISLWSFRPYFSTLDSCSTVTTVATVKLWRQLFECQLSLSGDAV